MKVSDLKLLRLKAGLSQEEAATRTGISRSYISRFENEPLPMSDRIKEIIAEAYGVHKDGIKAGY